MNVVALSRYNLMRGSSIYQHFFETVIAQLGRQKKNVRKRGR
jgi:hypothetical protein